MAEKKQQSRQEKVAENTVDRSADQAAAKKKEEEKAAKQAAKIAGEKEAALEKARKDEIEENKKKKKAADQLAKEEAAKEKAMREESAKIARGEEENIKKKIFMATSYPDYKIVLEPKERYYDEKLKRVKTRPGKYIQFIGGRYVTDDKEEIAFLNEYAKKHPNYIMPLDDHIFILQRAIEKVKKDELAKAAAMMPKGSQGLTSGI